MSALLIAAALAAAPVTPVEVTAPGPHGALAGTMIDPGAGSGGGYGGQVPMAIIIPGSGPTDRDGDNPMGVRARPYKLLAEALAARGVGTVRIDKRGMFASRAAVPDANAVTIAAYAADIHAWIDTIRARTGRHCLWIAGHSEGGLVALVAAQRPDGICGLVLIATAGRPMGKVMHSQFHAQIADPTTLKAVDTMFDAFEAGKHVDTIALPPPLNTYFVEAVQAYVIDLVSHDPVALAARLRMPILVVQGDRDLQIGVPDAELLAHAAPGATLVVLPGVNHVLKDVTGATRIANFASYGDPMLPLAPGVTDAIVTFVIAKR